MAIKAKVKEKETGEEKENRKLLPGVVLVILGMIFLMNNYGVMYIDIGKLWPLFLIIPGILMLREKPGEK